MLRSTGHRRSCVASSRSLLLTRAGLGPPHTPPSSGGASVSGASLPLHFRWQRPPPVSKRPLFGTTATYVFTAVGFPHEPGPPLPASGDTFTSTAPRRLKAICPKQPACCADGGGPGGMAVVHGPQAADLRGPLQGDRPCSRRPAWSPAGRRVAEPGPGALGHGCASPLLYPERQRWPLQRHLQLRSQEREESFADRVMAPSTSYLMNSDSPCLRKAEQPLSLSWVIRTASQVVFLLPSCAPYSLSSTQQQVWPILSQSGANKPNDGCFPGSSVVKNRLTNSGNMGLFPDLGRSHMSRSN